MFGRSITLFRLFGFEVTVDFSWIILAVFITWSLARGTFPFYSPGLSEASYWLMGLAGAAGLFFSIVAHEFTHSLVARRQGLRIRQITLFIFGGVANLEDEPTSPRVEFATAVVGPLASVLLALVFWGLLGLGGSGGWPRSLLGVLAYLRTINLALAGFNLIPAFPLDGGRLLRAGLWRWLGDLRRSTRIASGIGSGFAVLLMAYGFFTTIFGNGPLDGLWWVLIGMFLFSASRSSYRAVAMREALKGERVRRFMTSDPVTVPPELSIERLVDEYVYRYHFKMLPVVENGTLKGCITTQRLKEIPRIDWPRRKVGELVQACSEENTVRSDAEASEALSKMARAQASRLMVVEDGRLVGVIALKDLLRFLNLKAAQGPAQGTDLESGDGRGG